MTGAVRALSVEEAAERLLTVERPLVLTHRNPDGDTVGTAAALIAFYASIGRPAAYASERELPERLAFLMDGQTRVTGGYEAYTAVAVDVASTAQLGTLAECLAGTPIALTIDHHAVSTPFSDVLCLPEASSAGEVLYEVLAVLHRDGRFTMNERVARLLYAAISSDSGCFRYSNAGRRTHAIAAELLHFPFDAADINHRLFVEKTPAQIAAEGYTAAHIVREGDITYAVIPEADREALGLTLEDFDTAIDVVRALRGTRIAFIVKEVGGASKVSLRTPCADVARVAARFGGGGHIRAAGCTVPTDGKEAAARMLAALREECV